ncbi:hypothetical protein K7432_009068 [Basidiobolus ranarum]|uniref:Pyridoxamine 5'-phosphate oxidase putative domain-containing protein n=1 Tax=Basidiobolus ranarum TaxID=34480 RepID=A0ABR2VXN2_9FUNG
MGNFYETISTNTQKFVNQQEVFWVASAPLSSEGRVNVSPKGTTLVVKENDETYQEYKVFWVLSENKVAYLDFFGSGVETLSHLRESNNGRITLQFNAFEGSPRIIRLFGHGKAYDVDSPEFLEVLPPDLKNHVDKLAWRERQNYLRRVLSSTLIVKHVANPSMGFLHIHTSNI